MKVLIVFNHPAPYKIRLFNELASFFDLTVIFERKAASDRVPLFYSNDPIRFNVQHIPGICLGKENHLSVAVIREIKKHPYDLIIMNGYSTLTEMLAIRYMRRKKIPYALYVNGGIIRKESKIKFRFKKSLIEKAFLYFSPCEEVDEYLMHYGARSSAIRHYPYSTVFEREIADFSNLKNENVRRKESLGIPDKTVFVSSGQFIERKNNLELLEIWKKVPENKHLFLIGSGKQAKFYQDFVKNNGLKNVEIKSYMKRSELLDFYRGCDAFVTLSKEDIYGHMINEALSQGLPVISSDKVVSARHLIKQNENGYLVNYTDHDSVLEAIEKIGTNDFSLEAIKTAQQNTIELMVAAHVKIMEEKYE
mgnify:CR=1 FL=1